MAKSLIEEFKKFPGHTYHIVLGVMLNDLIDADSFGDNFCFYRIGLRPAGSFTSLLSARKYFSRLERRVCPDVVLTTSGPAYGRFSKPHIAGYNLGHYIYSDSPFFSILAPGEKIKWKIKGALINYFFNREADVLVVQTEDIRWRLQKKWPDKSIHVVSNTYSTIYNQPVVPKPKLPRKDVPEFRLLTLSAWYNHKNLQVIPRIIQLMSPELLQRIRFVLTLPEREYAALIPVPHREYVLNVGPIPPDEGPSLYAECDAMFLPTLLECFSASYAEAMAMRKPILTSDLGFAHTVCGDAALYFDPMNPHSILQVITSLLDNAALQRDLIDKGVRRLGFFGTAHQRAAQYLEICKSAIETHG